MRPIERGVGLLLTAALLVGCGQQSDSSFCATYSNTHWEQRTEIPRLQIEYTRDGAVIVQLTLPPQMALGMATVPDDILLLPNYCEVGELQRYGQTGEQVMEFKAQCGELQPKSLDVPLLQTQEKISEIEVSMSTPAVRKHFIVHRKCDRALFNIAGATENE